MAVSHWNSSSNTLSDDEDIFEPVEKKWVRKGFLPFIKVSQVPSTQEAFSRYKEIIDIKQDKKTSFVRISVSHESANIAKKWSELIVSSINQSMRDEDRNKANKSLEFLNNEYSKTNYKEIKQSIASLQEEQMKSLMLIEASKFYVFKILDYPIAPERKSSPKRSIIVLFGIFVGLIFSILVSLIQFYAYSQTNITNRNS